MRRLVDAAPWRAFLIDRAVDPTLADLWAGFVRPSIRLVAGPVSDDDACPVGASKLGGNPDLPVGTAWPLLPPLLAAASGRRQSPLAFLGQLDLSEIARIGCDLPLPESGLLSFFCEMEDFEFEAQPWLDILYFASGTTLRPRSHPAGRAVKVRPLELSATESLPHWIWLEEVGAKHLGWSREKFSSEILKLDEEDDCQMTDRGHSLGGWPTLVQGPMFDGDYRGESQGWRLLLQLASDEPLGWIWGSYGTHYVWWHIDPEDLGFQDCRAIIQCT